MVMCLWVKKCWVSRQKIIIIILVKFIKRMKDNLYSCLCIIIVANEYALVVKVCNREGSSMVLVSTPLLTKMVQKAT